MPPFGSRPGGRLRLLLYVALVLAASGLLGLWGVRSLGYVLYHEDLIEPSDAIFVLAGAWLERVAEAGDLYRAGQAPFVVLSREQPDNGERMLRARGIDVPSVPDLQVKALEAMGVPRAAIVVTEPQVATATEAATLRRLAEERQWHRVIVVTSKYHTARAKLAFNRRLKGANVQILVRGSRYDTWPPDHWWDDRIWIRFTLIESQKMILYWLGIAD
ncbi:MAG TPA: YdcF family protein [Vicinamibacterales bacterium]|nr:YdcF family protein [Vicinamibacterales bacterium]